jgi:hypothetical protein
MVNEALSLELQNGLHALSIVVSYAKKYLSMDRYKLTYKKCNPFFMFIYE